MNTAAKVRKQLQKLVKQTKKAVDTKDDKNM